MTLLLLLTLLWAPQVSTPDTKKLVVVIERERGAYVYQCNGRKIDFRRLTSEIGRCLGGGLATGWEAFLLVSDDVSIGELSSMQSFLGNTVGVNPIRLFGFSRRTGIMSEIVQLPGRWKLSFDGRLEPTHR